MDNKSFILNKDFIDTLKKFKPQPYSTTAEILSRYAVTTSEELSKSEIRIKGTSHNDL